MFNNLMFISRIIKGYSKSFNLILQYDLEAQQLIKRAPLQKQHYLITTLYLF